MCFEKNILEIFYWNVTLFLSCFPLPAALPPPIVSLHPSVFLVGGNYTVYCDSTAGPVTNFTLSLYYRILPVTPGTNWTFAGSVFLTDGNKIYSRYTNAVAQIEFVCTMEMLYNGKVLRSLQSKIEQAFPGTEKRYISLHVWELICVLIVYTQTVQRLTQKTLWSSGYLF